MRRIILIATLLACWILSIAQHTDSAAELSLKIKTLSGDSVFTLGDSINIHFEIENMGKEVIYYPVHIGFSLEPPSIEVGPLRVLQWKIKGGDKELVGFHRCYSDGKGMMAADLVILQPGDKIEGMVSFGKTILENRGEKRSGQAWAGTYQVQLNTTHSGNYAIRFTPKNVEADAAWKGNVDSNIITVIIRS